MTASSLISRLELTGLRLAPSQVWGRIRLIPLIREQVRDDLRIARRVYRDNLAMVSIDGELMGRGLKYFSYIPHGLVVSFGGSKEVNASYGTSIEASDGRKLGSNSFSIRLLHRMVKREEPGQLRLLPLHLAMESFLALHFNGPEIAWGDYSKRAISSGLDPRMEMGYQGAWDKALEEALRIFEIHEGQVGVLIFSADQMLAAAVFSHPEDYRRLHRSLLEDFYGELLIQYGWLTEAAPLELSMEESRVGSLAELRAELGRMRAEWADFHGFMAEGLIGRPVSSSLIYELGPFQLQRFMTDLVPTSENHIGEAIVREDGTLEYLKTFRLSGVQTRRAYLLKQMAAAEWHLETCAEALRCSKDELIRRIINAGFGYLLQEHVQLAALKRLREKRR